MILKRQRYNKWVEFNNPAISIGNQQPTKPKQRRADARKAKEY